MQEDLLKSLMKTFNVNADQAARLLMELKQCVKRKNLVSFFKTIQFGLVNFTSVNSQKRRVLLQLIYIIQDTQWARQF